jgi:hypothetical protein
VAVLDVDVPGGEAVRAIVADTPALAEAMGSRLRGLGMTEPALDTTVVAGIERVAAPNAGSVGWRIALGERSVDVMWSEPSPPFWLDAPAPALVADEDIWACFIEYADASVTVDGIAATGRPFADDAWVPKVGRTMSSAHVAFGEVRVDPEV